LSYRKRNQQEDNGWPASQTPPPTTLDVLTEIISDHTGRRPQAMPPAPTDAARWWIDMQEKPAPHEAPHRHPVAASNGRDEKPKYRWITPYTDRLRDNLRIFLTLTHEQHRLIIAAREDDIYWRGDDVEHRNKYLDGRTAFENVIYETERMRKIGVDAYKAEALQRMRKMTRGFG